MRLTGRGFRHHHKCHLAGLEALAALRTGQNAALWRKNARDADEVAGGDAGGSERELERGQLLAVLPGALGKEHLLGNESDHVALLVRQTITTDRFRPQTETAARSAGSPIERRTQHGKQQHTHCQESDAQATSRIYFNEMTATKGLVVAGALVVATAGGGVLTGSSGSRCSP